jgi:TolB-like protein/serine/threonine protein kinase/Flp pilus assembly protein TadD
MALASGSRLGTYEIRGALGSGGMSEVYRAHDPRLGRDVALKILPEAMAQDPLVLARFAREARALAALSHPHIVTIFSTEEDSGLRFLTMELIEGRTLDRLIPRGGVPLPRFFDIAQAISDALAAAHQKQITHRDLKPANVMVTDTGRVKVLDFGLARGGDSERAAASTIEPDATTRQRVTEAGMILGTMPYMSPEQIEAKPLDPRTDIFSLGIVMYEMASGGRPFRGDSPASLMASILKERPKPLSELRPDLPIKASSLVSRCLAKDAQDRVQSAQQILLELRALQKTWESGAALISSPGPSPESPVTAVFVPEANTQAAATIVEDGRKLWRAALSRRVSRAQQGLGIAVASFTAYSADHEMEGLAQGLREDIATGLARFPELTVLASGDTAAAYVLEGSVRRSGDSIRASLRLVDSGTGTPMWAETFDRSLGGHTLFELQDEVTSRTVATLADAGSALVRSMAASVKDRPVGGLSLDDLALRYLASAHTLQAEEHQRLRAAFERALNLDSGHAVGWACLASLVEQEHALGFNPRPRSRTRAGEAARRSVEIDPLCQAGWRAVAAACYFERDQNGLQVAAERALALNPLNSAIVGYVGMALAHAGDWDRGIPIVKRAMELNRQHPNWFHLPLFSDHYRRTEYEEAVADAKRVNAPQAALGPLSLAAAAGQQGRTPDARAAVEALQKNHSAYLQSDKARALWSLWLWDRSLIERLMEGLAKARALVTPNFVTPGRQPGQSRGAVAAKTPPRPASVAVLPFTDVSDAKDQEWLGDGVAEAVLLSLACLDGLKVAPLESALSFKGKAKDLRAIGEKLNVTTLLVGSARCSSDRIRIAVQLSDVQTGATLWVQRHDRDLTEIFDVQEEIAGAIADRLNLALPRRAAISNEKRQRAAVEAHLRYLRARSLVLKRGRRLFPALDLFQQVVDIDHGHAAAWTGMAEVLVLLGYYGFVRAGDVRKRAIDAARRAVELDPESASGHSALACVLLLFQSDSQEAEREFKRALELNPQSSQARGWYAFFLLQLTRGLFEEGAAEARRALQADPHSAHARTILGACLGVAGRHDQALPLLRAVAESDPLALLTRHVLGLGLCWAGKLDEAATVFEGAARMSGYSGFATSSRVLALSRSGRMAEAKVLHEQMKERSASEYVAWSSLAEAAFSVGDRPDAVRLALRACDEAEPQFLLFARQAPHFSWLREQPEWPGILKRLDEPRTTGPQS